MALFKLIHLLAALVWIGGMFFAYVVLRPTAVEVAESRGAGLTFDIETPKGADLFIHSIPSQPLGSRFFLGHDCLFLRD